MRLKPPKFIRWLMPDLIWEMKDRSAVYLTFDDGPTPGITEWILSTLDKYDAKATFFVLGKNAEMYPDLYRRIVDAGHRIGNHTYSHQKGWGMSLERYIEDVDFANDLLHTELFRPPYARITPAQARALAKRYKLVMWDVLSRDYNRALSPRTCLRNVTHGAGDYIPDGPYTLLDANTAEELPAGTMIAGIYDASYGGYWGCWFYSVRRQVEARLVSGMVDVSREGDIYTLELKLKDGAGRNVTATYTGKLTYYSGE